MRPLATRRRRTSAVLETFSMEAGLQGDVCNVHAHSCPTGARANARACAAHRRACYRACKCARPAGMPDALACSPATRNRRCRRRSLRSSSSACRARFGGAGGVAGNCWSRWQGVRKAAAGTRWQNMRPARVRQVTRARCCIAALHRFFLLPTAPFLRKHGSPRVLPSSCE